MFLGISNFLEEISSLFHSVFSLYFFALFTKVFFISFCYSLELCIQLSISFPFSLAFLFSSKWYLFSLPFILYLFSPKCFFQNSKNKGWHRQSLLDPCLPASHLLCICIPGLMPRGAIPVVEEGTSPAWAREHLTSSWRLTWMLYWWAVSRMAGTRSSEGSPLSSAMPGGYQDRTRTPETQHRGYFRDTQCLTTEMCSLTNHLQLPNGFWMKSWLMLLPGSFLADQSLSLSPGAVHACGAEAPWLQEP